MFNLAQALMMGSSSGGIFGWSGWTHLESEVSFPDNSVIGVEFFPDGRTEFRRNQPGDIYPGKWLNQLNEGFGNLVEVRATEVVTSPVPTSWLGDDLDVWHSLNIAREFFKVNSGQPPTTDTGVVLFEFALASNPGVVVFSQEVSYYSHRSS